MNARFTLALVIGLALSAMSSAQEKKLYKESLNVTPPRIGTDKTERRLPSR